MISKFGAGLGLGLGSGGGSLLLPETRAYIARMATPTLTAKEKAAINNTLKALIDGGYWDKIMCLYFLAHSSTTDADHLLNVKSTGYNATKIGSPTLNAGGMTPSAGNCLALFNPYGTDGTGVGIYRNTNNFVMLYSSTASDSTSSDFGASDFTSPHPNRRQNRIGTRQSLYFQAYNACDSSPASPLNADGRGQYGTCRVLHNSWTSFAKGVNVWHPTNASNASLLFPDLVMRLGGLVSTTAETYGNKTIQYFCLGGNASFADYLAIEAILVNNYIGGIA